MNVKSQLFWTITLGVLLAIFIAVGWPFNEKGAWIKSVIVTVISGWFIFELFGPFFISYSDFDDSLNFFKNVGSSGDLQTTRTHSEMNRIMQKNRPNWRMGKPRIRKRVFHKNRVRSKMC